MPASHIDDDRGRGVNVLLMTTALLMASPVLVFRWAPVNDLGDYELILAALRDFGDPSRFSNAVYRLNLGGANQLIFAPGYLFAWIFGADLGVRILLAGLLFAVPWTVAHAAHTLGCSRLVAVTLSPFALGYSFRWGLIGYLAGVLLALLALRPFSSLLQSPNKRTFCLASGAIALATLAHGTVAVLFVILAAPEVLRRLRVPREAFWVGLSVIPSLALTVAQLALYDVNANNDFREFTNLEHPRLERLYMLPAHLSGYLQGAAPIALCVLAALALGALARGRSRKHGWNFRLLVALIVLAQYWIWPYGHNGAGLLYLRFLLPGVWLLAFALSPAPGSVSRVVATAQLVVPCAMTLALLPSYYSADAVYRALDKLEPHVAEGSALASLDFVSTDLADLGIPGRAAAHLIAKRGGRTWSFADAPQYPVRIRDEASWMSGIRHANPGNFVPEIDLERYRYVLAHVPDARFEGYLRATLGRCSHPVAYSAPFALFESRCLRFPPHAPEPPLPADRPKTLGWRLRNPDREPHRSEAAIPANQ